MAVAGLAIVLVSADRDRGPSQSTSLTAEMGGLRPASWREYTYEEAVAAGLVNRADFARPKGVPLCGPLPAVLPSAPDNIPDNAPSCYRPPEEQGAIFLVPDEPLFPGFLRNKSEKND